MRVEKRTAHQVKVRQVSIVNIDQALDWISQTSTLNPLSSIWPAQNVERFKSIALENLSGVNNQSASFAFIEAERGMRASSNRSQTAEEEREGDARKHELSFHEDF